MILTSVLDISVDRLLRISEGDKDGLRGSKLPGIFLPVMKCCLSTHLLYSLTAISVELQYFVAHF